MEWLNNLFFEHSALQAFNQVGKVKGEQDAVQILIGVVVERTAV